MRQYEIALTLLPGIGDITAKKLVAHCGAPEAVFRSSRRDLLRVKSLGTILVDRLMNGREQALDRAKKEISFIDRFDIKTLFFLNKSYPYRLANCIDGPVVLFYKGNADLNAHRILGVVGTRNASTYGLDCCNQLIEGLAAANVLIISGLAFGIDCCAHKKCVSMNMPTVGVLGHGLDRIYPLSHKNLAGKMIQNGGLVTDFTSQTIPDRENFPKRNRIIAGLCDALLVVEAAEKGGALITADIANSYDRDVFAFPGKITDKYSAGCNRLIKNNQAALIESAEDIKYLMSWDGEVKGPSVAQPELFVEISAEERSLMDIIKKQQTIAIDELVIESGMHSSRIAKILLNLEFKGLIRCLPGKRYQLI